MKPTSRNSLSELAFLSALIVNLQSWTLCAQGTAFTYQGRLDSGGAPANGTFDLQFAIYDSASGGSQVGGPLTNSATAVSNGLFTVTLDFGAGVFTGAERWLELAVRTNGSGAFTTLAPRQPITATPYAILASNVSGVIPNSSLPASPSFSGTVTAAGFAGNGSGLTSLDAAQLTGTVPAAALGNAWKTGGNAGTTPGTHFLGTTDNQPLEIKVKGQRALRIEPNNSSPNLIGGCVRNYVAANVVGATIGGGGADSYLAAVSTNRVLADFGTVGGGWDNAAAGRWATVGGGWKNTASGENATASGGGENTVAGTNATVAGGWANLASQDYATVAGGAFNTNSGYAATVAGGYRNRATRDLATVGGGYNNIATGTAATVPGGVENTATNYAFAAGRRAKANHTGAFVWSDSTDAEFTSTRSDQFNIRASGGVRIQSDPGIALNPADTPLITRGWDAFGSGAPAAKQGHGRWGLFMEPYRLVIGIPGNDIPGRYFSVAKYDTNGTYTALMTVDQTGAVTAMSFTPLSDRNGKENFEPVNPLEVLERVAALPIQRWQFKEDATEAWHLGPVAQDFHAAFGLGSDDKHIATVDADGVALAAIQGLNQKLEARSQELGVRSQESEARIQKLEAENAALKTQLAELKELVRALAAQQNGAAR